MIKKSFLLIALFSSCFLYANDSYESIFGSSFPLTFKAKSNFDIGKKLDISYKPVGTITDTTFAPTTKNVNTYSLDVALYTKIWRFDLGAGVGYQVPTSSGDFGDFYFIPAYLLTNFHFYEYKNDADFYAIYQQGIAYSKGSNPYNTGNLEDGSYFGYGLGCKVFSDIHIEFMIKNYQADNNDFKHEFSTKNSAGEEVQITDLYNLSTKYQTYSISFGISNVFDDFLNHLY